MSSDQFKIKIYWLIPVTKRQFLIFYGLFIFIFLALAVLFMFIDYPVDENAGKFSRFVSTNFSLIWICFLIWMIVEGQFFWQKFTRKQLSFIKAQRDQISLMNEELKTRNEEIVSQRDEIEAQRNLLLEQRDKIALQRKEILDSINYAFRIQTAILPPDYHVDACLKENFIVYFPKSVVSGDFYFVEKVGKEVVVAAVDCTGHGVPGAMMSVLGYNLLDQAVKLQHITDPGKILEFLDIGVTEILRQAHGESGVTDGMDLSVCTLEEGSGTVRYAGAFNSLYYVHNNELVEIKADKLQIGVNVDGRVDQFNTKTLNLTAGDMVYLFSDGYADQFGGPKGKKFKYSQLRELLLSVSALPAQEQKNKLEQTFRTWQGELEQVDDVLLMGIRIG